MLDSSVETFVVAPHALCVVCLASANDLRGVLTVHNPQVSSGQRAADRFLRATHTAAALLLPMATIQRNNALLSTVSAGAGQRPPDPAAQRPPRREDQRALPRTIRRQAPRLESRQSVALRQHARGERVPGGHADGRWQRFAQVCVEIRCLLFGLNLLTSLVACPVQKLYGRRQAVHQPG